MYIYLCYSRCHADGGDQDLHRQATRRVVPAGGWRGAGLADRRRRCVSSHTSLIFLTQLCSLAPCIAPLHSPPLPLLVFLSYSTFLFQTHPFIMRFYLLSFSLSTATLFNIKHMIPVWWLGLKSTQISRCQRLFPLWWPWQQAFMLKNRQDQASKSRDSNSSMCFSFHVNKCFFFSPRLVWRGATARWRKRLVPRRVRRTNNMPGHHWAERAEDGPPAGAGD